MWSGRSLGLASALVGLLLTLGPEADAADPSFRWYTITTKHFEVHYYRSVRHDERDVARRVARLAERAHRALAPMLRHVPTSRTQIVVTDTTDGANGSAQIIPYNIIRLFVTAPDARGTLNDYDDWLYMLIVHEYLHILHIDTIHGLPVLVNAILGKTWSPNQIQPRWFVEGFAVQHETQRTSSGRNRSAVHDMTLRTAVLEKRFLGLDQISSSTRHFPRGNVPYLYGGRFIGYIAARFGEDKLTDIGHAYGTRPIPYGLNKTAKDAVGHTYEKLYKEFHQHLVKRYELMRDQVRARGETKAEAVTNHGWTAATPRYSPDGVELAFVDSNGYDHGQIMFVDPKTKKERSRIHLLGTTAVAFSPDRRLVVYDRSVNWRTFHNYRDLYVHDRKTGAVRQLTDGSRAREPDISPDGRSVIFATAELGQGALMRIPIVGGKAEVIRQGTKEQQFSMPRYSPDGRHIVYSIWRRGGRRDIEQLTLATGKIKRLTDDRAIDLDPQYSSDGKRVYFSSDRTGIYNIYCVDVASGRLRQVTNVVGGAFSPAVSPDEKQLYFVSASSRGFDLKRTAIDRHKFMPALPYIDERPPAKDPLPKDAPERRIELKESRYNPLPTLWPRAWSFDFGNDGFGAAGSITLSGADAVGRHAYGLRTAVSFARGFVSYGLNYSYSRFWPTLGISHGRATGRRGGVSINGANQTYIEENYALSGSVALPLLRIPEHAVTLSIGYAANWFRDADDLSPVVLPGDISPDLPETGFLGGASFSLSYRNIEGYALSVSPEKGRAISLSIRADNKVFGSDFDNTQFSWSWQEYIRNPWLKLHVLALRYAGGVTRGDFKRRGVFAIGGFPNQDLLQAIMQQTPFGGAFLRGFPPGAFAGPQFHMLNMEYRFPLWDIERGFSSLPIYFNFVHMALFADVGDAFRGQLEFDKLKVGVGAEILVQWSVGYVVPLTFRFGYARGLRHESGSDQFFFFLANRF